MMHNFLSQEAREMGSFTKKGNMGERRKSMPLSCTLCLVIGDDRDRQSGDVQSRHVGTWVWSEERSLG